VNGFDFLVTHRTNGLGSGVARFNEVLAARLGIPVRKLFDPLLPLTGSALLSFKVSEMDARERDALDNILDAAGWRFGLFLHDWESSPAEVRLVREAAHVFCGNLEVEDGIRGLTDSYEVLWSPGLILDVRRFEPTDISVFSFGMAHKIQTPKFERLRKLLDASERSYAVYVSSANHEAASLDDGKVVFEEMARIFPTGLRFLGRLSDAAVYNYLKGATFFAAFFEGGVRDNNGTVAAAMDHGAVVITNLDEFSPRGLVHLENVIDLDRCDALPTSPAVLEGISARAVDFAHARSWDELARRLAGVPEVLVLGEPAA
jgi:hypothetical protein